MGRSRGEGGQGVWNPLKNRFSSNTGTDPLKSHNSTKPALDVGPSSACQGNSFEWRFAGGLMLSHLWWYGFGFSLPSSTKKMAKLAPPLTIFLDPCMSMGSN